MKRAWAVLMVCAGLWGCGEEQATGSQDHGQGGGTEDNGQGEDRAGLCVAVRGNGPLMPSHWGSLARIHEHYGPIQAVSGGSSGSITSFLLESIYSNPAVYDCGGRSCGDDELGARMGLMFKSLEGYVGFLGTTDEALALQQLAPLAARLKGSDVGALLQDGKLDEARAALEQILTSEDVRDLINPELLALLADSPNPAFHLQDLWGSLSSFGSFEADSDLIFLRPGVVSFEGLAEKVGRIGSFYAGYGPTDADAWAAFLEGCASPGLGKTWREVAALDAGGASCGERFGAMLGDWRGALLRDEAAYPSRVDDVIGARLPTLISTSVLTGDAVEVFDGARASYLAGEPHTWVVKFSDVRFGYWGQAPDLAKVEQNAEGFEDAKTQKFLALGEATWREALSLSPAEPGLARALEIGDTGLVSVGGWPDLEPTLVLRNLGCEEVLLLTRRGEVQGGFGPSVAKLLGASEAEDAALYDLDGDSAIHRSLAEADAVWCTDWNNLPASELVKVIDDGWSAPMETQDPYFTDAANPYPNALPTLGEGGCSPGVAASQP